MYSGGNPFGAGFDAEDILNSFFGGRHGSFGFRTAGGTGFDEFSQVQQVGAAYYALFDFI